jgi:uncharacterized protein (DUF488 family)
MKQSDLQKLNIFTIGHGNKKIENFIDLLHQYQIKTLIDVRTIPYSRFHTQFRQVNLKPSLENAGITYIFLGNELGGRPKNPDLYLNGHVNYEAIKKTELFKGGIQQVINLAHHSIKVTLMCSESDQNECHRKHLIAGEIIKEGLSVMHINKIGNLEKHQIEVKSDLFS